MASFLVTGTSRGLGLGLVETLASLPAAQVQTVFAATRSSQPNGDLAKVVETSNGRITHIQLDVDSSASISKAASQVSAALGGKGLDYLINNAAVREPKPAAKLEDMTFLREALATNVVGTHEVITTFLPLLRQGKSKKIILFSSTLGAISTAQSDPHMANVPLPAYKISKAGTHMLTALWSNQLKAEEFCVYMQSPGNLKTELAGGDAADLPVEVGAKEVIRIALASGPADSGRHQNILVKGWEQGGGVGGRYDGLDLPW